MDASSSDLEPVTTILPERKTKAVDLAFSSLWRITTAAKRRGLYSELREWRAIYLKSKSMGLPEQVRVTVATMFYKRTWTEEGGLESWREGEVLVNF